MWARCAVFLALFVGFVPGTRAACPDFIATGPRIVPAAFQLAQSGEGLPMGKVAQGTVRLTFIGHATFLIESPDGVKAVTDYTDYVPINFVPDIITMNHFHPTHYSDTPDPRIPHILRGWNEKGGTARISLQVRDMRVFNVQTNFGEFGYMGRNENSIFVFSVAGLCIAHLSHTHHTLSKEDLAAMGEIDVLLVPVDGMYTLSEEEVFDSIAKVKPKMVVPWHYSYWTPSFIARAETMYPVKRANSVTITFAKKTLPEKTEVVFLDEIYAIRGWPGFGAMPGLRRGAPGDD
jgi:L-ascorbate metabolism protein UlaG (beta-lactamase superfamily)